MQTIFEVNAMSTKKNNVLSDGVKNAAEKQEIGERLNMPIGKKKPQKTRMG